MLRCFRAYINLYPDRSEKCAGRLRNMDYKWSLPNRKNEPAKSRGTGNVLMKWRAQFGQQTRRWLPAPAGSSRFIQYGLQLAQAEYVLACFSFIRTKHKDTETNFESSWISQPDLTHLNTIYSYIHIIFIIQILGINHTDYTCIIEYRLYHLFIINYTDLMCALADPGLGQFACHL